MQRQLNKTIKQIMAEIPVTADILNDFDIACSDCNVADCLLKDIVDIHDLPEGREVELMYLLEKAIYPDRDVVKPEIKGNGRKKESKKLKYSPPMKKLVDEHVLITKWIALIPEVLPTLDINSEDGKQLVKDSVDFIRSYADKFHHAKEEEILFKYFDESLDIIRVILTDHNTARGYTKAILEALDNGDRETIIEKFTAYAELLSEHIRKENEILLPWMSGRSFRNSTMWIPGSVKSFR